MVTIEGIIRIGGTTKVSKKIGLVGYGYWGSKLARCFSQLGVLEGVVEPDPQRNIKATEFCGRIFNSLSDMINALDNLDAIAVSTPPETHYGIARETLNAGKDVFIEKPMTVNSIEAEALNKLAETRGCNLMVGHIYLHNEGIKAMTIPVGKAELYVQLLNEVGAPSNSTRDVIWAGLPHACSLALHFFPDWPEHIEAKLDGQRIRVKLQYWNGSVAFLDVGDNTGRKLRKVELRNGENPPQTFDVAIPNCLNGKQVVADNPEPLKTECESFLGYQGVDPMGLQVVKLIEEILHASKP